MKRSEILDLIANQLDFLNGKFAGYRVDFNTKEIQNADVILTTLEHAGMLPPLREKIENDRFVGFSSTLYPEWEQE